LPLTAFAADLERERARPQVTDSMMRRERAGHVRAMLLVRQRSRSSEANGERSHVERRVNEGEGAIVAESSNSPPRGRSQRQIAKRVGQGPPHAWVKSRRMRSTSGPLSWRNFRESDEEARSEEGSRHRPFLVGMVASAGTKGVFFRNCWGRRSCVR
jgi:hypothetical protein